MPAILKEISENELVNRDCVVAPIEWPSTWKLSDNGLAKENCSVRDMISKGVASLRESEVRRIKVMSFLGTTGMVISSCPMMTRPQSMASFPCSLFVSMKRGKGSRPNLSRTV